MGQVTHVAEELGAFRRREFRWMLLLSVVAHAGLLFALSFRPSSSAVMLPGVVAVELVAAPPAAAPPAPVARPEPEPPPPPPVAKKVVLPKEPTTPKVEPKPAAKKPPPKPVERDLDDVLADLRADAGEKPPEKIAAAAPAGAVGVGQPVPPEVAVWIRKAKIHVRQSWVLEAGFRTQHLEAHVLVDLDARGNVKGEPRIIRRSGNPWYDESVVRAIQKASPLPPPPAADEWAFVFIPSDSY